MKPTKVSESLPPALTVGQTAALMCVSPRRVRALLERGQLAGTNYGGQWLVDLNALKLAMEERAVRLRGTHWGFRAMGGPQVSVATRTYVHAGYIFRVCHDLPDGVRTAGRYIAEVLHGSDPEGRTSWARVAGSFGTEGKAVAAAKREIGLLAERAQS